MHSESAPEFHVLLLGDKGVGKTTFIEQYHSHHAPYPPTLSVVVDDALTTRTVVLHELSSTLYTYTDYTASTLGGAIDGAILMFDVTRPETYYGVEQWYEVVACLAQKEIPIVLCANKTDLVPERRVHPRHITFHVEEGLPYYEVSQVALNNLNAPLWRLIADAQTCRVRSPAEKEMFKWYVAEIQGRHEESMRAFAQYKQELAHAFEMLQAPGCAVYDSSAEVRLGLDQVLRDESVARAYFPLVHRKCVRFILHPSAEAGEELVQMHTRFGEDVAALQSGGTRLRMLVMALMVQLQNREAWVQDVESVLRSLPAWSA